VEDMANRKGDGQTALVTGAIIDVDRLMSPV
jgi:hypothetical protein